MQDITVWAAVAADAAAVLSQCLPLLPSSPALTPTAGRKQKRLPLQLSARLWHTVGQNADLMSAFAACPDLRDLFREEMTNCIQRLEDMVNDVTDQLSDSISCVPTRQALRQLIERDFVSTVNAISYDIVRQCHKDHQCSAEPKTAALDILHTAYTHSAYPTPAERDRLARACGMTSKQVTTWFANARQRGLTPAESKRKRRAKPYETPHKISSVSTLSSMPSLSSSTSSDNSPSPPTTSSPALSRSSTSNSSLASSACMPLDLSIFDNLLQKPVDPTFDSDFISSFLTQQNALHSQVQLVNEPQQLLPPFQLDQPMDFQLQAQAQPFNFDRWFQQNARPQPETSTNFDLTWLPAASTSSLSQAAAPPTFDFTELLNMPLADEAVLPTAPASTPEHDNAMEMTDTFWQDIMQSLGSQPQAQVPTADSEPLQDSTNSISFASLPTLATADPCGYFDSLFNNSLATNLPTFDFSMQTQP